MNELLIITLLKRKKPSSWFYKLLDIIVNLFSLVLSITFTFTYGAILLLYFPCSSLILVAVKKGKIQKETTLFTSAL